MFISPQAAESLSRMKQGLAAPDTIIAVTGYAGVGKSTLVSRTLHAISGKNAIVRIGEKRLDPDDVLEMLLVELGTAKALMNFLPTTLLKSAQRRQCRFLKTAAIVLSKGIAVGNDPSLHARYHE